MLPVAVRAMAAQPAPNPEISGPTSWSDITVGRVMREKAESGASTSALFTVKTHDLVIEAVKKMAQANVGSVIVLKGDQLTKEDIAGIITERDYLRKVAVEGKSSSEMTCSALMTGTRELSTLTPNDKIVKAMQLMEEKNIRHIPIFDSESLLGMLSVKDVVATLMSDRDTELNHMTDYVNVTY